MDGVSVIVMEPGSPWPGHVRGSENVVTLGQLEGDGLLATTQHRLEALAGRGQRIRVAVLACNGAADGPAVARRAAVAHALLDAVAGSRFGRLVISAPDHGPIALRRDLAELVSALTLARPDISVRIRFINPHPWGPPPSTPRR